MLLNVFAEIEIFVSLVVGFSLAFVPYMTEKSINFGIRIPVDKINSDVIRRAKRVYAVSVIIITLVMISLDVALHGITAFTVAMLPIILILGFSVYFAEHYRLLRIKKQENWFEGSKEVVTGQFVIASGGKFPFIYALPGILIILIIFAIGIFYYPHIPSVFPTHFGANGQPNAYSTKTVLSVFLVPVIGAITTLFIIILAYAISPASIREDTAVRHAGERTNIFRHRMVILLSIIPVFINITFGLSSFEEWELIHNLNIAILIAPVLAMVVAVMVISFATGQVGSNVRIRGSVPSEINKQPVRDTADDDKYWKGGVIYVNRNDGRILVPKRFGVGFTFNMGHPAGIAILAALIAIPAIILILIFVVH
ncbi:MAG: DUF1648 domain-containing protein [Ferroplasma sp.]|uniref:DUF1648 domain-containing protein n=1 Tax=Ferroplasma sp. TaxID=2591003 RepID=UPI0028154FAC|nr:DUF1648 domain-containing protein [Ferroplasma sp.]WMT50596.1 MAG: DUF1648 domain-containing protein [Ferroplasma sp.]